MALVQNIRLQGREPPQVFFAVMRPRLRKQNPIKYIDKSALDKDLLVLKKALGNKIPLSESRDWELPFVIELFKHSNIEVYL